MSSHGRLVYRNDLTSLRWLSVKASSASAGTFKTESGIRLENGLLTVPNLDLEDGAVLVDVAAPGPCYSGIVFRMSDFLNFELFYAQPHTSGFWDAIQYDPVLRGSNTWQIHHGLAYQQKAVVPTNEWYTLCVEFAGDKASAWVGNQSRLYVERLALSPCAGAIGLWTYLPAYFKNLRVYDGPVPDGVTAGGQSQDGEPVAPSRENSQPRGPAAPIEASASSPPPNSILEWLAEGYGVIYAESNGIILLNRFFPVSLAEATLTRRFVLERPAEVRISLGFSDKATATIDGQEAFSGANTYKPTPDRAGRGYVQHGRYKFSKKLAQGEHSLSVRVGVTENFGWGLAATIAGDGLELLPARSL